jgi:hypothetical protein
MLKKTWILSAGVALIAVSTLGGCKKKSTAWKLPVDAKQLPSNTTLFEAEMVEGTQETDPKVKDAFTAAELGSEICREGTANPALQLEIMTLLGIITAKPFFQAKNLDQVRSLMECGSVLAAGLKGNFQTAIGFVDDSGAKAEVDILEMELPDLPPKYGLTKHAFGSLDGYCRTTDPLNPKVTLDCGNNSEAALKNGSTWFLGKKIELDQVSKTIATPRTELSSQLSALNDAANELEGLSSSRVEAQLTTAKPYLAAPCAWGGNQSAGSSTDFMAACFPTSDEKTIQDIDGKLRAAAFEIEPDVRKAKSVHGTVILVARDDDAGKTIEKDATELVTDWKSTLENNEAKLEKQAKDKPVSLRQKSWAIIVDNYIKALRNTKVTRSGRVVKLSFNEPLTPEDLRDLEDTQKKMLDERAAVADVLNAITAKQPIPAPSLTKLVGPTWATYLVALSTWDPKNPPPECAAPATPPKKGQKPAPVDPKCKEPVEPPVKDFGAK